MKTLALILTLLFIPQAHAWNLEATAAASATTYDGGAGQTEAGLSARFRVRHYGARDDSHGLFYGGDFPGISPLAGTLRLGYGISSKSPIAWEAGAGIFRGPIFGSGVLLLAGVSKEISSNLAVSFPIIYSVGFTLEAAPSLIWSF